MELNNDFEVAAPVDRVWAVLTDVERIAPCLPGAQLQEVEGEEFRGVVKVKVGPITAQYKGAASFVERDDAGYRAVLRAEGRDTRGAGNASADITAALETTETGTKVTVTTELTVTGKVAQFGRGVMADVSKKLMGQFADNLSELVASPDDLVESVSTAPTEASAPADQPPAEEQVAEGPAEQSEVRVIDAPEAEAVDLLDAAGAPVLKRLVPTLVALAVVAVVILILV
ncbi:MAG: SRPBCC family protein [Actinomycetota bacterium]|nr:SRPBCC family protein [Actinomycetota bacterium]MED6327643.1 SRPBCC family protein [Actinomycetota bacterium]MEE2958072.1 SRPBCC family protein [Actinomycetota bacterium]